MDCPVCREPMAILEYNQVEVDYCPDCHGVWLDEGEMELLLGDADACARLLSIGSPCDSGDEKDRPCPACDTKMTKEATETTPPVVFDACPLGHGLWFDAGELQQILRHGAEIDKTGRVRDFLKGLFGESLDPSADTQDC